MTTTLTITGDALPPGTYPMPGPVVVAPPSPAILPATTKWGGINLTGIGSTNREYPFADWVKSSRKFGTLAKTFDAAVPVGPDGWPLTDGGAFWDQCRDVNGDYQVSCPGNVQFKAFQCAVTKAVYDAGSNVSRAVMTVNQPTGSAFAPSLAVISGGKPWRGLKIIAPGGSTDGVLSDVFVNSIDSAFRCVRFMDWAQTNFSQVSKWSDRAQVSDAQWSIKGVPWEVCIQLCNRLNCDGWFNVPCLADDDYVARLGALLKTTLKPGLHAYIEDSNEKWNGGTFSIRNGVKGQYVQNAELVQAEIAAGDKSLAPDGNLNYAAFRRTAKRSYQIRKILNVLDPDRSFFRVVLPIGVNAGWQMVEKMDDWITANTGGKSSDFFYAVAGAPYFTDGKTLAAKPDATVDELIAGFAANAPIAGASQGMQEASAWAHANGMKFLCYEMGIDNLQVDTNLPNKIAAQQDPRIGGVITSFLTAAFQYADGGCFFSDANSYNKDDMFGLRQHVREMFTPKYMAVREFMRGLA